jgi:hypothetical protein
MSNDTGFKGSTSVQTPHAQPSVDEDVRETQRHAFVRWEVTEGFCHAIPQTQSQTPAEDTTFGYRERKLSKCASMQSSVTA